MAAETILHSGEFLDQNDNMFKVTFYKRTDLNAVPSSMSFGMSGGTQTLVIWSRTGEAILRINPTYSWLNYQQVSAEPIVGTEYHKYTYNIICDATTTERTGVLDVGIEYGQGVGETIQVVVTQSSGYAGLSVSPSLWSVTGGGASTTFSITNGMLNISQTTSYITSGYTTAWLSVTYLDFSQANVTAWANDTASTRFATITFYELSNPSNRATVSVTQYAATLTVSPSYLRFGVSEAHSGFTARWTAGSEPTMSYEYAPGDSGWMSIYGPSVSGSTKTWNMVVYSNTTLVEREAMITITNGIDTVSLPVMQNRQ